MLADLRGEEVRSAAAATLPTSWRAWLDRLLGDEDWHHAEALQAARLGEHEWTVKGLLEGRPPEAVAAAITSVPASRAATLSDALPHLLGTLQSHPQYPDPALSPLYAAILQHVAYEDPPTEVDVRLYVDLLPAVLMGRLDAAAYARMLDEFVAALEAREAAPPPEVVLDALDAAVAASCPDPEARLRLFAYGAALMARYTSRWGRPEYTLLRVLADEAGCAGAVPPRPAPEPEAEAEAEDPLDALAGAYIAIYTLTESAGARAADVLARSVPDLRVETSAALAGEERLAAMARNADVFVMVTRSAQHAATDFIEARRGAGVLLRPLGKGSASILRALRDYAGTL